MPDVLALVALVAHGSSLPPYIRSRIVRLLLLHWRPDTIVDEVHYY